MFDFKLIPHTHFSRVAKNSCDYSLSQGKLTAAKQVTWSTVRTSSAMHKAPWSLKTAYAALRYPSGRTTCAGHANTAQMSKKEKWTLSTWESPVIQHLGMQQNSHPT
jgi:hypothetical protein